MIAKNLLRAVTIALAMVIAGSARAAGSEPDAGSKPAPGAAKSDRCFEIESVKNSKGTMALLKSRHLHPGGPTWLAVLEQVLKAYTTFVREGTEYTPDMPGFGVPMHVTYKGAETWYIADDEGNTLAFCAGDKALLDQVHADYLRLNKDAKALETALNNVDPDKMN